MITIRIKFTRTADQLFIAMTRDSLTDGLSDSEQVAHPPPPSPPLGPRPREGRGWTVETKFKIMF